MSYEPHTWVDREIISDQKMNHIENGIYEEETRATNAETLLGTGISDEELRARTAEALLAPQATTYTKTEVDNMFSALASGLDWKESVATYADIATTYPDPEDGWTVNVKDTDITYRYDGADWVAISANAIPKATSSVDGLMAKEDYSALHGLAPEKLGFGYGTCSTASGTTAKTVSVTDFVLKENGMVVVAFTNAVEAGSTLNVNSTGAKAIYYRGVALVADVISAGDTVTFVYDGTYYHVTAIDIGGSGSGGHIPADNVIYDNTQSGMTATDAQGAIDELNADKANKDLSNVTGTLAVANGGTGQTTLALARNAMGLGNTTGALPVANGGTGATTADNARTNLGLGGSATQAVANNLTTTTAGSVLDARQGKALNDSITGNRVVLANSSATRSISNTTYTEFDITLSSAITNFKSIEVLMGTNFGSGMRYYDLIQAPVAIVTANGSNNRFRRKTNLPTFNNQIEFYYVSSTKLHLIYESASNLSGNYVCWYYVVGVKN